MQSRACDIILLEDASLPDMQIPQSWSHNTKYGLLPAIEEFNFIFYETSRNILFIKVSGIHYLSEKQVNILQGAIVHFIGIGSRAVTEKDDVIILHEPNPGSSLHTNIGSYASHDERPDSLTPQN